MRRRRRKSRKGGRSQCYVKYHGRFVTPKTRTRLKKKRRGRTRTRRSRRR